MNYKLTIGTTGKRNTKPTLRDINIAIDSLNADKADPFIILEPAKQNDTGYIQVLQFNDYNNMKTSYHFEIQIGDKTSFKQYEYITDNKAEIKRIFEEYFLYEKTPDVSSWTDITSEILEHKNTKGTFYLYDLAKKYHRDNKKLFNCYDLSHGDNIAESIVYQSVAEAIILFRDIMCSNGNCGEIYYMENGNRFFLDVVIPDIWKEIIKEVKHFKSLLSKDKIYISCYDHNDIFIPSKVSPLTNLDRLLPCFILLVAEKMMSYDKFLYTAMDFFSEPNLEKFNNVYIDFLSQRKHSSYFVIYENDENYDHSKFSPLSELYKNFADNIKR